MIGSGSTREDYLLHLKSVSDMSSSINYRKVDYLIYFSLGEKDESLIITITDGINHLWARELDYEEFKEHRKKIGLEGPYETFF